MTAARIKIELTWQEEPGDAKPCRICQDIMFYKVHALIYTVNGKPEATKLRVCDSCYNQMDHGDQI